MLWGNLERTPKENSKKYIKIKLLGSVCPRYFTYIIFYDFLSHARKEVLLLYFSAEEATSYDPHVLNL